MSHNWHGTSVEVWSGGKTGCNAPKTSGWQSVWCFSFCRVTIVYPIGLINVSLCESWELQVLDSIDFVTLYWTKVDEVTMSSTMTLLMNYLNLEFTGYLLDFVWYSYLEPAQAMCLLSLRCMLSQHFSISVELLSSLTSSISWLHLSNGQVGVCAQPPSSRMTPQISVFPLDLRWIPQTYFISQIPLESLSTVAFWLKVMQKVHERLEMIEQVMSAITTLSQGNPLLTKRSSNWGWSVTERKTMCTPRNILAANGLGSVASLTKVLCKWTTQLFGLISLQTTT